MEKTLYLEKRGCNFFNGDTSITKSDVGNYRVGSYDYSIEGKDGRNYIIEFCHGTRYIYRHTNKKTGAPLKHAIKELLNPNAIYINTQFEDEEGTWRNIKLEEKLFEKNYNYTLSDILAIVNEISKDQYTKIEFINK